MEVGDRRCHCGDDPGDLLEREGWQPAKAYFSVLSRSRLQEVRRQAQEMGNDAFSENGMASRLYGTPDEEITTAVDVRPWISVKRAAFASHTSQNDPEGPLATMAASIYETALGTEFFVLARGALAGGEPETDLFTGID